ncbi:MAG: tetratricopeptide repeat protein, partial [Candidatus Heimdallarchaeaceae archaeon]
MTSSLEKELENLEIKIYQGKYTESMDRIDEILDTENLSIENKIRALNHKSLIEFYLGIYVGQPERFKTAHALDLEAYKEALKIDNPTLLFTATMFLSWSNYRLSISKYSRELRQKLLSTYERICLEDPSEAKRLEPLMLILETLQHSIRAFRGEPVPEDYLEEGIKLTKKAMKLSEEVNNLFARQGSINNLIDYYYRTGRREEQYNHIIKLLDFWEELGNKYAVANVLSILGGFHYDNGEYELYLDYMTKRLRIWEELKNETGIASHNIEMGAYYESQRKYDKTLEYYKKALDYFSTKEDLLRVSYISQNIGYVYRLKGDLLQALEFTKKVFDYCNETKYEGWWNILPNLSAIYLLMGDLDKALHYEEENLNLHKTTSYVHDTAFSLSRICMIYWQKGFEDKAISDAQKSLKLFEEIENPLWTGNILADLIFFT